MSRSLRVEFSGVLYHVTARGDRREPILENDHDRHALLEVLGEALERFDASWLANRLTPNHDHLVRGVRAAPEIPRAQRRGKERPLAKCLKSTGGRDEGVLRAYREGGYTRTAIARALDLSVSRISRVIRAAEAKEKTKTSQSC